MEPTIVIFYLHFICFRIAQICCSHFKRCEISRWFQICTRLISENFITSKMQINKSTLSTCQAHLAWYWRHTYVLKINSCAKRCEISRWFRIWARFIFTIYIKPSIMPISKIFGGTNNCNILSSFYLFSYCTDLLLPFQTMRNFALIPNMYSAYFWEFYNQQNANKQVNLVDLSSAFGLVLTAHLRAEN